MSFIKEHLRIILSIIIPIATAGLTVTLLMIVLPNDNSTPANTKDVTTPISVAKISTDTSTPSTPQSIPSAVTQYGDKYASGLLPVGDGKSSTTTPAKGIVFVCQAASGTSGGGATTRGPWFVNNNTEYDTSKKVSVSGKVMWTSKYTMTINGTNRVITTNDLPADYTTGIFPIQSSDAAYIYDHNPNTISSQSLNFTLPTSPTPLSTPGCVSGGNIGVITTGVALFDAFDAGGRDAGAWEIQDGCGGHPQQNGEYHYHTLSSCITNIGATAVIGYALDGYPITGPTVAKGNIMTTNDLDECHGITSSIILDGKMVNTYHYVMTQDFPYSISCFHAKSTSTSPTTGASKQQGPPPKL